MVTESRLSGRNRHLSLTRETSPSSAASSKIKLLLPTLEANRCCFGVRFRFENSAGAGVGDDADGSSDDDEDDEAFDKAVTNIVHRVLREENKRVRGGGDVQRAAFESLQVSSCLECRLANIKAILNTTDNNSHFLPRLSSFVRITY